MEDMLKDATLDLLLGGVENKVTEVKDNYEWKKLFIDSGAFLSDNQDTLKSFGNDLYLVFSKDNMKEISRKLRNKRGYEFPQLLHDELYDLMVQYEISTKDAETYIHHFTQIIISYLEKNDSYKILEIYLGEWRKNEEKNFFDFGRKLDFIIKEISYLEKAEVSPYSIIDIDAQIRKESLYKGMSLDFFELDDEQFETKLDEKINDERIFVVGKSREETIYRILNVLRRKYPERVTLIIKSEAEWKKIDKENLTGNILIPFFLADSIAVVPNNTNIFIYGEDEPCYYNNKLKLRKRTKQSIIHSLEKIGINTNEAYNMVDNTHGLYVPLKKKLFNGAIHNRPKWMEEHSDTVMAALLCGKWTESDGDILIFEEISGKKYSAYKKEQENYMKGDNPYIVSIQGYSGSNMQLASIEDAWEELDAYISDEMWGNFVKLFYEVLIESEPIFEYPFDNHFEASIYAEKPEWSPALKRGMIRTLIMRAYYRGHDEYQRQIDNVVEQVLETITTKERWGYISQYITDLCEASPKAVIKKLEDEVSNPTGLLELFAVNDGDFITGRHYYTHILWAVEQLLQQKMYVVRAVEWLWKMNSYEIKYSISNSPKSVLEVVFCAWLNSSVLSVNEKINLAKRAIETYPNAWDIIFSKFPNGGGGICSTLCTPKYRRVDEPDILYVDEMNRTYIEYLYMCVNALEGDTGKWKKIIKQLHWYDEETQKKVLEKLCVACNGMSDLQKIQIKDKIRYLIYRHRYFSDADWCMGEKQLEKYEKILNEIIMDDGIYDFLYLFSASYDFPLLHPVSFDREEGVGRTRNKNDLLREKEIETQINIFKECQYSLDKLVTLAIKENKKLVGEVLAQFYCGGVYDEDVLDILLKEDKEGNHVYDYIRFLTRKGSVSLNDMLKEVKNKSDNENLIVNLISLEEIEDDGDAIIAYESETIKRAYWSRSLRLRISEKASEKVCLWALSECQKYGTLESYLEMLFDLKDKLLDIQLYELILVIEDMRSGNMNSIDYYLGEILKIIQESFLNDLEKCSKIAAIEWLCRNILEWEQMKCMQYMMKIEPSIYANLVQLIYKSEEDGDVVDKEKSDLANKVYSGFDKAKFCPTEKDGKVNYESLKEWLEKFKELLISQKQDNLFGNLIGRLLAYSPIGEDGYMPCEAVRIIIEEYYSESLKNSYVMAEENKRGVHTADAGKSEMKLYQKYRNNAEALQCKYPHTAEIYFDLSASYKWQADRERRRAEDEW